uniref:transporter substrate-binding domain-containing protein n=1 Tax=Niallia sp. XMNu-256 TaxID=3082444 RepID=UPI00403FB2F2
MKKLILLVMSSLLLSILAACGSGNATNQEIRGFTVEDADGGYAIAFPKGSELREEFNNELKAMIDSGEMDGLINKWLDPESEKDAPSEGAVEGNKVLKMATSADYAPFEYIDTEGTGDYMGLDIEIARIITERLGYKLEIQDMDFGGLISALQNGQADFVMSAMSATDDRKESVDFSDIYYTSKHVIVSTTDSGIESLEDLKDKKVGVQMGSIQEEKGKELAEEIGFNLENRNRIPELIQEIKAGRLDAAIIEDTVAEGYLGK